MTHKASLIDLDSWTADDISTLLQASEDICSERIDVSKIMNGRLLCPVFLQESSRTFINTTSGFVRMGGQVQHLNLNNTRFGSKWAEPIQDFCTLINSCFDFAVFRTADVGTMFEFDKLCNIPIINAGNGSGVGAEHPVQALVDLFTIQRHFGASPLNILMLGGTHIRSTRSQIKLFSKFGHRLTVMSPPSPVNNNDIDDFCHKNCRSVVEDISEVELQDMDIIYHNGIDEDPNVVSSNEFVLDLELLRSHKFQGKVMHSLPRKNELQPCIDNSDYNLYFEQMENSKYVVQSVFLYQNNTACNKGT